MSDLIRRDAVIDALLLEFPQINIPLVQIALERVSAVDAVEVVRSRDCKYSKPIGNLYECPFFDEIRGDEYCSNGERREENAVD